MSAVQVLTSDDPDKTLAGRLKASLTKAAASVDSNLDVAKNIARMTGDPVVIDLLHAVAAATPAAATAAAAA